MNSNLWHLQGWRRFALLGLPICVAACGLVYEDARYANIRACEKLPGMEDRNACVKKNQTLFDQYERQRQDTRIGPNEAREAQQDEATRRNQKLCIKREGTGELVCPN